jgi:hypothetical protein
MGDRSADPLASEVPELAARNRHQAAAQRLLVDIVGADAAKAVQTSHGPPLYVKDKDDADEVDANDIKQGPTGDCWFLAAVLAIAQANPEAIKRLIHDNGDGTYDVTLYRFHIWDGDESAAKEPFVVQGVTAIAAKESVRPGDKGKEGAEVWPLVLENALIQYKGGRKQAEKQMAQDGLDLLSPGQVQHIAIRMEPEAKWAGLVDQALRNHAPVVASSIPTKKDNEQNGKEYKEEAYHLADKRKVVVGHAYAVSAIDLSKRTISLRNPWGRRDLDHLAFDDFKQLFQLLDLGESVA